MQILAFDTSTVTCAVALGDGARWAERVEHAGQRHSELLLPMIRALLAEAGVALSACDDRILPTAVAIGNLALPRLAAGQGVTARDAAPLYLRHRVALTTAERGAGIRL